MPEGPTIRNTADRLREVLRGQQIMEIRSSLKKAASEDWSARITGHQVRAVRSHGKNLFIDFDSDWTLYTHMLMWGAWHVYALDEPWSKEASKARVVLRTPTHCVVLFSAPICQLLHASELAAHPTSMLGPDLLSESFGVDEFEEIQRRLKTQGDVPIGETVMNQTVMAGIGNILKSEILFAIRVHPQRLAPSLEQHELAQLIAVSRELMRIAYDTDGFSQVFLPEELRQISGMLGYVYGRSGQICLRCGGTVAMIRQGASERTTFFCPFCQPFDPNNPPAVPDTPRTRFTETVRTLEEARDFVLDVNLCGVLHDPTGKLPTLWDVLVFPEDGAGRWKAKFIQVWTVQRQIATTYPAQIFAGRIKNGRIVLMSMQRLKEEYALHHRPLEQCSELAQHVYDIVDAQGSIMTLPLRQAVGLGTRKERSRFDRALRELQTTFNIVRSRASETSDIWVPFCSEYPAIG